ncbi:MAG TPA: 50S ribosomal protein L9 [Deltaproteobacteria bacterium]|nr:50S ribosomal protein L9 [Deltaproteobacteria bacterium]HPP80796.1 50S ribosomal protein L9 [Deltaproteobacteria bacterium]
MNVVLLETIEGLGSVGQEVKVKDGYARNYLIPKGLALLATDKNIKAFKSKIEARIRSEAKSREHAQKLSEQLASVTLRFKAKTGQEGKLFGSITTSDIFEQLEAKGFEVDKKKIHLAEPIRHTGTHEVDVRLFPGVVASVKVEVVPEDAAD